MKTIDVGIEFSPRLANRDKSQGDGKNTAEHFREKYLSYLDNQDAWEKDMNPFICFDFSNVKRISPSFANEAFGHFAQYATPEQIRRRIKFENISEVLKEIIEIEIESAYRQTS